MKYFALVILGFMSTVSISAQVDIDHMPKAFIVGEYEELYESLVVEHNELLLTVCSNSMDKAYENWVHLLSDLERYAEDQGFDIKGTKIWINFFWNTDGTIKHIVYYPKPNSKNMDFQLLSDFLSGFADNYQFILTNEKPFSHYGSASFPTFSSFAVDK